MRLASGKRVHTFAKAAKLCATLGVTAAAGHPLCPPLGIPLSKPAHRPAIPRGHQDHEHLCNSSDTPASLPLLAPRSHNVLYIAMLGMASFSLIGAVRPGGNDSGRCRVGQHFKW